MTLDDRDPFGREAAGDSAGGSWASRVRAARLVIAVAGAAFLILLTLDTITRLEALAAFGAIAVAAMLPRPRRVASAVSSYALSGSGFGEDSSLEALLTGLPDPTIVLDRKTTVIAYNSHALAVAPALARSEPLSFALRNPDIIGAIRRAADSGDLQRVEFFERVPADRWFEAIIAPVRVTQDGAERTIVIVTLHDQTPLRRVEQMRADFIANASHELRTPLATLSGFIDTLQGAARDDPAARVRFLAIMREQATRMGRLIDDLLSLSRIELTTHIPPVSTVDLLSVVWQVADSLQSLAKDRGVTIEMDGEAPLLVPGDRDELIRVFENLIENALKYGASGKRVVVSATREGEGEVVVTVRDFGPGIAPDHLPRLTERFYRVDVAESRMQGGTGLGLSLVKHILTRHRGRLTIDSMPGQGAAFIVRLPASTEAVVKSDVKTTA